MDIDLTNSPHPSCFYHKQQDETSKLDLIYKNCKMMHPQYYFNNLGLIHMKLKKNNLAILYFSKALKFLDKPLNG